MTMDLISCPLDSRPIRKNTDLIDFGITKNFDREHMISFLIILLQSAHYNISLARTPEIGQGLGRILSCGARKPEQT